MIKQTDNKLIESVVVDLPLKYTVIRFFGARFIVHTWLETVIFIVLKCLNMFENRSLFDILRVVNVYIDAGP